jgi:hypothetical protein
LLSDLRHDASPPEPAPRREAEQASGGSGGFSPRLDPPPPPAPQYQPAPQRYVGVYVTEPDGRRTFIANQ